MCVSQLYVFISQGHPRFRTLTRNIRKRRGKKVAINIPIFKVFGSIKKRKLGCGCHVSMIPSIVNDNIQYDICNNTILNYKERKESLGSPSCHNINYIPLYTTLSMLIIPYQFSSSLINSHHPVFRTRQRHPLSWKISLPPSAIARAKAPPLRFQTTFTWTLWASAWAALVSK